MGIALPRLPKGRVDVLQVLSANLERPGVGTVYGQAGRHFHQRRVQLLGTGILGIAVGLCQQVQVQAERMRLAGEELLNYAFSLFIGHVGECILPACDLPVRRCDAFEALGVHRRATERVHKVITRRAGNGPLRTEGLLLLQDLLNHDKAVGQSFAQAAQVLRGVVEPIDMIDAQPGNPAFVHQFEDEAMRRREDFGLFHVDAHQVCNIEEAAVIYLFASHLPKRQYIRLLRK